MTIEPQVGSVYLFKHSTGLIHVEVVEEFTVQGRNREMKRWRLINKKTNRALIAKSKRKFLTLIDNPLTKSKGNPING